MFLDYEIAENQNQKQNPQKTKPQTLQSGMTTNVSFPRALRRDQSPGKVSASPEGRGARL